jgi:hypothetical protein
MIFMVKKNGTKYAQYLKAQGVEKEDLSHLRKMESYMVKDPLRLETKHSKQALDVASKLLKYSAIGTKLKSKEMVRQVRAQLDEPMRHSKITPNQALKERALKRLAALRAQPVAQIPSPKRKIQKLAGPKRRLP